MKNLNYKLTLVFLVIINFGYADPVDPPVDSDPPPAPINDWLGYVLLLGILYAFYFFKYKKQLD